MTRLWREMDSNHRSPARKSRFLLRKANCSAAIWMGRPALCLHGSAPAVTGIDLSQLRSAIRETRKLAITYIDEEGRHTQSRIWPIAMAYYVDVTLVGAWCELWNDFRHFRVDRILASDLLDERFSADSGRLSAEWLALRKDRPNASA
jgi:predicted DNA-binding transcriptional regulator YafY